MKKITLLFLVIIALIFYSCSKDDGEDVTAYEDPILGTWFFYSYNGELVNECKSQSNLFFQEGEALTIENYEIDGVILVDDMGTTIEGSRECELEISNLNWRNNDDGSYSVISTGTSDEETLLFIDFSDDNQTVTITYDSENIEDGETLTETLVYKK